MKWTACLITIFLLTVILLEIASCDMVTRTIPDAILGESLSISQDVNIEIVVMKDYILFKDAVSESGETRDIVHRAFTGL